MAVRIDMSVSGSLVMESSAKTYYDDIFITNNLKRSAKQESPYIMQRKLYSYGAEALNKYYLNGIHKYYDGLPRVTYYAQHFILEKVIAAIKAIIGHDDIEIIDAKYATFSRFSVKYNYRSDSNAWTYWEYYYRYILEKYYNFNFSDMSCQYEGKDYEINWLACGNPLNTDYNAIPEKDLDGNIIRWTGLDNTDYGANGVNYSTKLFIVANHITFNTTFFSKITDIIIENIDKLTDKKTTNLYDKVTTKNDAGDIIFDGKLVLIKSTSEIVPIDSIKPSKTEIIINEFKLKVIGEQKTWFAEPHVIKILTTNYPVYTDAFDKVSFTVGLYKDNKTEQIKAFVDLDQVIPPPTNEHSNQGSPNSALSVAPMVNLMMNDQYITKDNYPDLYLSINRQLKTINLDLETLGESTHTGEAPKNTIFRLRVWLINVFYPYHPVFNQYTNFTDPSEELQTKATTLLGETISTIMTGSNESMIIRRTDTIISSNAYISDPGITNRPDVSIFRAVFADLNRYIIALNKDVEDNNSGFFASLLGFIRDKNAITVGLQGEIDDMFIMVGINPITTAFHSTWDSTLPKKANNQYSADLNNKIIENNKKRGVDIVSEVLFKYFRGIQLETGTINGGEAKMTIDTNAMQQYWVYPSLEYKAKETGRMCKIGEYIHRAVKTSGTYTNSFVDGNGNVIEDTSFYYSNSFDISIYHQLTNSTYEAIIIKKCTCTYKSNRRNKFLSIPYEDDGNNKEDLDKELGAFKAAVIPMPLFVFQSLPIQKRIALFPYSVHLTIFAIKETKLKWYQSSWFKILMTVLGLVVMLVLMIAFPPAGVALGVAVGLAIGTTLAVTVGIQMITNAIMNSNLSKEVKTALIALVGVLGSLGSFINIGQGLASLASILTTCIDLINVGIDAANIYVQEEIKEIKKQGILQTEQYENKTETLQTIASELKSNIDVYDMINYVKELSESVTSIKSNISLDQYMYVSKEAYLDYDLLFNNSYNKIKNYVQDSLRLQSI